MKIKKIAMAFIFVLAITASFAFKAETTSKPKLLTWCSMHFVNSPNICDLNATTDDGCYIWGTGSQCTVWDWEAQQDVQAYETDYITPCSYPLYHQY